MTESVFTSIRATGETSGESGAISIVGNISSSDLFGSGALVTDTTVTASSADGLADTKITTLTLATDDGTEARIEAFSDASAEGDDAEAFSRIETTANVTDDDDADDDDADDDDADDDDADDDDAVDADDDDFVFVAATSTAGASGDDDAMAEASVDPDGDEAVTEEFIPDIAFDEVDGEQGSALSYSGDADLL